MYLLHNLFSLLRNSSGTSVENSSTELSKGEEKNNSNNHTIKNTDTVSNISKAIEKTITLFHPP